MRILVAGVGSIGQRHIRNLRARLGSSVEILAHRVRGREQVLTDALDVVPGAAVAEAYGLTVFDDLEAALDRGPDAVFVCNPTRCHVDTALAAVRAGRHVFVEKPLSDSEAGVPDLVTEAERRGLVGAVGYQLRFHPGVRRMRDLVRAGAIGRPIAVHVEVAEHLPDAHPYEDYRESYAARADLGGGAILSFIHEFDYLYWMFGRPRRVFAAGGRLSDLEIDVEDTAVTVLEFECDGRPLPAVVHQDFVQRPPRRRCRIAGDAGAIELDLAGATLAVTGAGGREVETHSFAGFPRNQLFLDELDHFLASLAGTAAPAVSLREGAASLRIALAARHSLRTGEPVVPA